MKRSAEFEKLIESIYRQLSPNSTVTHNDKFFEKDSQSYRQIDVSIKTQIEGCEYLTIVEARDHKRPQDITAIDAFASRIKGVGANRGILICNAGFTSIAITKAKNLGIDLCTAHEALSKNWNQAIAIPILWVDLSPEIYIEGKIDLQEGVSIPISISEMIFSNNKGNTRLCLIETFIKLWHQNLINKKINQEFQIKPAQKNIEILTVQNQFRTVTDLQIKYKVLRHSWLKRFPANDYREIQNFVTKDFKPVRLAVGPIPLIRDASWAEISDPDAFPGKCHIVISTEKIIEKNSFDKGSTTAFSLIEKF